MRRRGWLVRLLMRMEAAQIRLRGNDPAEVREWGRRWSL